MKVRNSLLCGAIAVFATLSAQAAVDSRDVPRISNGSTGYIGLTESAGTVRIARFERMTAGPDMSAERGASMPVERGTSNATRAMGAAAATAPAAPAYWHRQWGTPD